MSHETIRKRAYGSKYSINLDMAHTGGRDVGSVSIWKNGTEDPWSPNTWIETINVNSESEGVQEFEKQCKIHKCKEVKKRDEGVSRSIAFLNLLK